MKVKVFLGYDLTINLDEWKLKWENGEANDPLPYGYIHAKEKYKDVDIVYLEFNKIEKKLFKNIFLGKIYLYIFKLPIELLKCDVVWTHYDKDSIFIAKLKNIPILKKYLAKHIGNFIWLIDDYPKLTSKKIKKYKKLLKNIDKIIFLSKSEEEKFEEYFDCSRNKLQYVRFGINTGIYSDKKLISKPITLSSKELEKFILFVGSDRHRDIDILQRLTQNTDSNYIIATNNNKFKKMEYSDRSKVISCSLKEVKFLYDLCDFVVIPLKFNYHASGCTTLIECAAAKKAVIVSDIPGIEDYVINGETGIVVPVGDEIGFIKAINYLKDNPLYCKEMGRKAYELIIKSGEYTTEKFSYKHYKISKELIKNN